jgi:hypothetical protein
MTWYDDAMRTIIELPADQLADLAEICRRDGISRAEAIRQAVAGHLERERRARPRAAFGLWRDRDLDGLEYERRLRREWTTAAPPPARRRRRRTR